jgi:hypothetical protein
MADRTIENPDLSPATGLIAVSGLVILLVYTVKATQSVEGSPEKKNQILYESLSYLAHLAHLIYCAPSKYGKSPSLQWTPRSEALARREFPV